MGNSISTAYYISAGRNTMTQDDMDHNRLIVQTGLAFVKPAEFELLV